MKEKIGQLTVELEKTKADNVKLYGKIRYVQDYNLEKVVSRGSKKVLKFVSFFKIEHHSHLPIIFYLFASFNNINYLLQHAEDLESGSMSDVESKYKKIYEDDINPFAAFSRKVFSPQTLIVLLKFRFYSFFPRGHAHITFGQFSRSLKKQSIHKHTISFFLIRSGTLSH